MHEGSTHLGRTVHAVQRRCYPCRYDVGVTHRQPRGRKMRAALLETRTCRLRRRAERERG